MKATQDALYTKLTALGIILLVISLVVVGCANDDDDGDDGNGGGGGNTQIDRMAVPGVNTALISSANKNAFNQGDPSTDVANFQTEIQTNMTNLRAAVNGIAGFPAEDSPGLTVAQVTAVVCPDIVSINFANPVVFPNGRQLSDDVIDPVLGLVLNRGNPLGGGGGIPDAIANDSTFSGTFPYLAAANP
jgi:hypothetical protein